MIEFGFLDLAGTDVPGFDFRRHISGGSSGSCGGQGTAGQRLDEPLQVAIARFAFPEIDCRTGVGLAAEVIETFSRSVLRGQEVAAVFLSGKRPQLPGLGTLGFENDRGPVVSGTFRHRQHQIRLVGRLDRNESVRLGNNDPFLMGRSGRLPERNDRAIRCAGIDRFQDHGRTSDGND